MQTHRHWYQCHSVVPITTEDNTAQRGSAVPGWQTSLVCTQSIHQWASSTSHCIYWVIFAQGQDPSGPSAYWLRKLRSCHVWPIITHMCRKGNHWPKQPCTLLTMAYGGGWTQPHIYCTSTITYKNRPPRTLYLSGNEVYHHLLHPSGSKGCRQILQNIDHRRITAVWSPILSTILSKAWV